MNLGLTRFLKSIYRREPLFSFLLTIGIVDAVIGGVDQRASLLAFGLTVTLIAALLKLWQMQRIVEEIEQVPEHYLPPAPPRPPLPLLSPSRKPSRR